MADKPIIPFGTDPSKLAIVPVEEPLPLASVPLKQLVPSRARSYGQSYYAQPVLIAPSDRLLLKDKLKDRMKGSMIKMPIGTKLLLPRPNETIVGVKTNKFGHMTCARYTMDKPRVAFDGVRATPGQVKFIPPKETSKRPTPEPLEREEKHQRTTVAVLEKRVDLLTQTIGSL